jgi:hypothetical protein
MDDATAHKVRDLKLKILIVEKELAATHHNSELGQWLRAGHASQMAKAAERERERLEKKLEELKGKIEALTGKASAPTAPTVNAAPVEAVPKPKPTKKTATTKAAAAPKIAKKTTKK